MSKRIYLIGAILLVAAAAGFHRVPEPGEGFVVAERAGGGRARVEPPGLAWRVPLLVGLTRYSAEPFEMDLELSREAGSGLASREGAAVRMTLSVELRPDPERVLKLHETLGEGYHDPRRVLAGLLEPLRAASRALSYDDLLALGAPGRAGLENALRRAAREEGLEVAALRELSLWPEVYPAEGAPEEDASRRILLVGLDGADWRILDPLLDRGAMPNLARLVRGGVRARLRTISPILSPIIWTSAATGKLPEKHGIMDFLAVDSRTGREMPVTSTMRTARAFWGILSARGITNGTVGWWATWPAEPVLGFMVTDRVAYQLFGAGKQGEGLRGRTFPEGLILSLAPVIEAAKDRARSDVEALLGRPPRDDVQDEAALAQILTSTRIYHESALRLLREYRPRVASVYYEGTDTVAHLFMRYAPPRMSGVTPEQAEAWGSVVERYYLLQDELLGELLEAAGPETTTLVVSDHGFKSGSTRPQTDPRIGVGMASDWHRRFGIFAASGPGIRSGAEIEDLSVLDVTPTLLALLGLPSASDMDGKPAQAIFADPAPEAPPLVATYEGEGSGTAAPGLAEDPAAEAVEREMVAKLTALGYLGQTTPNASNNTGITLLQQGRYHEAAEAFRHALDQDPAFLSARVNLARAMMGARDWQAATRELRAVRKQDPGMPDVANLLGNISMETGDLSGATGTFREALRDDPGNPHLWNSLGIVLAKQGRLEEAREAYEKVVEIDPDYAEAINNIGLIQREQRRYEEAAASFERAIEADPGFAGSYNNLGLTYQDMGRKEQALASYQRGLEVDPANAIILNNRGSVLLAMGRPEEAKEAFESAVASDETYASAHNNLGATLGMLGDLDGELDEYLRAIELDPDYLDARLNVALSMKRQGKPREEERTLADLLERAPEHPGARMEMGVLLAAQGRLEEAIASFERAASAAPSWGAPRSALAQIYEARGQADDAVREAKASLALDPNQPAIVALLERLATPTSGSRP